MDYKLNVELSEELELYRSAIEATIKPYIKIELTDNNQPTWWQSKFGGLPYMPKGFEYPKSNDGEYLYLLAQINFAEVPKLEGLPEKGILQFYIVEDYIYACDNGDIYDGNYDEFSFNYQNELKVIYFSDVELSEERLITDLDFIFADTKATSPFGGSSEIKFKIQYAPVSIDDYRFNIFSISEYQNKLDGSDDKYWQVFSEYLTKFNAKEHKILGYSWSIESDLRDDLPQEEEYLLLLQIDSCHTENGFNVRWRESGTSNFFIRRSHLEKLDFTKILCNCDG